MGKDGARNTRRLHGCDEINLLTRTQNVKRFTKRNTNCYTVRNNKRLAMSPVTVSTKYQMVIPLEIRKEMSIKPGQALYAHRINATDFVISTKSPVDQMHDLFGGTKIWGDDPMEYLKELREDRVLI